MFGAIAGGIASALAGGAMSKLLDRKSGSAGMPRPISYAVFSLKKKKHPHNHPHHLPLVLLTPVYHTCHDLFLALSLFFFNDTATTDIFTLSLHDALPIFGFAESGY